MRARQGTTAYLSGSPVWRAALRAQAITVTPSVARVVSATAAASSSSMGSTEISALVGHTAMHAPQATQAPASISSSFLSMVMQSARHTSAHLRHDEWRLRTATQRVGAVMTALVSRASTISIISFRFGMIPRYSPR